MIEVHISMHGRTGDAFQTYFLYIRLDMQSFKMAYIWTSVCLILAVLFKFHIYNALIAPYMTADKKQSPVTG